MATPPNAAPEIERAIRAGDFQQALRLGDRLLMASKRSLLGWVTRARANLSLGRLCDADRDLDHALRLAPGDAQATLLRGMIDQRLGRIDAAVDRLTRLAQSTSPYATEAAVTLAETLYFANRLDAFAGWIAADGAWQSDPRAALFRARVRSRHDTEGAIADLKRLVSPGSGVVLMRVAGFDAVKLLDKAGRYREAFDLALRLHAETTPPFDLEGMLGAVRQQRALLGAAGSALRRGPPVEGVAMVVGVPRSGTTLLEQMLDRHPDISGIGEYDGVELIAQGVTSLGHDLRYPGLIPAADLAALQSRYLEGAAQLRRPSARVTFDKNLKAWRWMPLVAAVLPGAACFHVARDPRDTAISTFLSFFHPIADGWTASLNSLRQVIEMERSILPDALATLGIPHARIVYEDLVASPRIHAERCLGSLGLTMTDEVTAPEQNPRAVFTLSHDQVRRPINASSIGRWRNYAFAFDGSWDGLARRHDERRGRS